jgi:hypothetical protein
LHTFRSGHTNSTLRGAHETSRERNTKDQQRQVVHKRVVDFELEDVLEDDVDERGS